ncbi:MAG TPA: DUF192 domain-containing protein [Nitrososphaera sp.]|nr:DUF192 domain-containing protein [Nitrososphaera sp.]
MRSLTLVAVVAAAIAGIITAVFLFYVPTGSTVADTGDENKPAGSVTPSGNGYRQINVTANGVQLVADIASTGDQRSRGLAVKDSLADNQAMLFVFTKENNYGFWMYNMKFPIDIIWLDSNRQVVHIEHGLEPCDADSCPTYTPDAKALYVLETVSGFAKEHGIIEGMIIEFDTSKL